MTIFLEGDGDFSFPVSGESYRQGSLSDIVGGSSWEGAAHECIAVLMPQPNNPHDGSAVAVGIDGRHVGYIPSGLNEQYLALLAAAGCAGEAVGCKAKIVGGWDRDDDDWGAFGVKLDIAWPDLKVVRL